METKFEVIACKSFLTVSMQGSSAFRSFRSGLLIKFPFPDGILCGLTLPSDIEFCNKRLGEKTIRNMVIRILKSSQYVINLREVTKDKLLPEGRTIYGRSWINCSDMSSLFQLDFSEFEKVVWSPQFDDWLVAKLWSEYGKRM